MAVSKKSSPITPATKLLELKDFFRLETAARMLGCDADDLLHFGAIGIIQITAPVVACADFAWPVEPDALGFLELDEPVVRHFTASNRVGIFPYDLAKIEALGWTVPCRFYAPQYAHDAIAEVSPTFEEVVASRASQKNAQLQMAQWRAGATLLDPSADDKARSFAKLGLKFSLRSAQSVETEIGSWNQLRQKGFHSAWELVGTLDEHAPRTGVEHLFISRVEFTRISEGVSQTPIFPKSEIIREASKPPHGNVERFARPRLETLFAAIWLYRKDIKNLVGSGTAWARELDIAARGIWEEGAPPLEPKTVEELLQAVLSEDGIASRSFRSKKG